MLGGRQHFSEARTRDHGRAGERTLRMRVAQSGHGLNNSSSATNAAPVSAEALTLRSITSAMGTSVGAWCDCRSHQSREVLYQRSGALSRRPCICDDAELASRDLWRPSCLVVGWLFPVDPFWACPLRGTAGVNQTRTAPGFGPAGFHPQVSAPSRSARSA